MNIYQKILARSLELVTGVNVNKNTNIKKIHQIKNILQKMSVFSADTRLLGVEQKILVEDPPDKKEKESKEKTAGKIILTRGIIV